LNALLLGSSTIENILVTLSKLLELEKVESEIILFDNSTEEKLVPKLKSSDLFLMYPSLLYGDEQSCKNEKSNLLECIAAGYLLGHKGHFLVFAPDSNLLNSVFDGEPSVKTIGEAIGFFRRERKVFESNKLMLEARRIISEAGLGFSNKGLIEAVSKGMYTETQAFLDAGFSTETEDEKGVPLLSLAIRKGFLEICRLLMSYDARLNLIARDRRSSPVLDAVTAEENEITELLIEAGADLDFKNKNGQTALVVAIGAQKEKLAELLIDSGADVTIKDSLGMGAKDYAKLFSLDGIRDKIEKMI
jgi:hypothetical protein